MTLNKNWSLETIAVQGSYEPGNSEPRNLPIYQSTTYKYDTSENLANMFDLKEAGHIYSRISNPTVDGFEQKVAAIEGGVAAIATSSGQSATMVAIMNLAAAGDSIMASANIYGGTYTLFTTTFKDMGIEVIFFEPTLAAEEIIKLAKPNTKAVFTETIANPSLVVADFDKYAQIAKTVGVPLLVDNSFATGILCRPIDFGANVVILSSTKYLDGHGQIVGGVIVDGGNFDYTNGRFPRFTEPDESYHGLIYTKDFAAAPFATKARVQLIRNTGMVMAAMSAYVTNSGMETLHLRMQRHTENAMKIAAYLEKHPKVAWVKYPGLASDANYALAQKYLKGTSGVMSFGVVGGTEAADRFVNGLDLVKIVTHVSDVRSCALQPAKTTHRQLSEQQLAEAGVPGEMVRLSVGIENVEDIIADLDAAFAGV